MKTIIKSVDKYLHQKHSCLAHILIAAVALRCIWALIVPVDPISDSAAYDTFARNMVEHGVFGWTAESPGAFWPVGTSAIFAAFYYVLGTHYWPIVVFNILVSAGIIVLAHRLVSRFVSEYSANITAALLALWPSLILYVTILASELPFTLLVLASLDLWTNEKLSRYSSAIAAGLILALACYIRPVALLLPMVFIACSIHRHGQWKSEIVKAAIAFVTMGLLIAPWTLRNYRLFDHPVLVSTNGPVTLWMGNHPGTNGSYASIPEWADDLNEYETSQELGRLAKEYILADLPGFVQRSLYKLVKQHSYETIAVTWNANGITESIGEWAVLPLKGVTQAYWLAVLMMSFAGAFFLYREVGFVSLVFHPLVAPWLYVAGIHAIILAQDRYHFSSIPFIAGLCAVAMAHMIGSYGQGQVRSQT